MTSALLRRRARRDNGGEASLAAILTLAERARTGDEAARAVLHDALMERYPQVYGGLVRLAERRGRGRIWYQAVNPGRRAIVLNVANLPEADARARSPRTWEGRRSKTREGDRKMWSAFHVVQGEGAASSDEVVTYVSRYVAPALLSRLRRV